MATSTLLQQRAQAQYQRTQGQTVSPGQAVVMLYQGCVRFIGRGRAALEARDFDTSRLSFLKSQEIISELAASLNMDAGEISTNLMRLYDYMLQRLIQANIRRDGAAAAEVEGLLRSLLPAWEQAVQECAGHAPGTAAATNSAGRFAAA